MTDHERYRRTDRMQDVGFVFGALGAQSLPGPVLVQMLGHLHLGESAVRSTLSRMVRTGALTGEPAGRVVVYSLTATVMEKFHQVDGTAPVPAWGGEFAALIHRVPEAVRWYRDRLQYVSAYFGYGMLRPGVLIAARDRSAELLARLPEAPGGVDIHRVALRPEGIAGARSMVVEAWDLGQLTARYRRLETLLREALCEVRAIPADDQGRWSAFRTWNRIYREVIELQVADPHLPEELLPADWPRPRCRALLARLDARWAPSLTAFLREQAAARDGGLAQYRPAPERAARERAAGGAREGR